MSEANQDLIKAFEQIHRIEGLLLRRALPPKIVDPLLQRIVRREFSVEELITVHEPLPSLALQLERICELNRKVWGGILSEDQRVSARALVHERHQRLVDFAVFHVEGRCPAQTVEMWCEALSRSHSNFRWGAWRDIQKVSTLRLGPGAFDYEPGINLVRLNLVAHWRPQDGDKTDGEQGHAVNALTLREQASTDGSIVPAHGEVLSALGLSPELVQAMRSSGLDRFPGQVMAGYIAEGEPTVPSIIEDTGMQLTYTPANFLAPYNAMPLVITDTEPSN